MTPIENLLSRLSGVKQTGRNRWTAICSAHNDKKPSVNVKESDNGQILIICRAGCATHSVLASIGLTFADLYEKPLGHHVKPERRPFPSADVFAALGNEAAIIGLVAGDIARGKTPPEQDLARVRLAAERFQAAIVAGGF